MHSCCYQHIPHNPKGALFGGDMQSARAMGGNCLHLNDLEALSSILQCLAACVHVKKKSTLWPRRHILTLSSICHFTNQDCSDHTLLSPFSVIQSWWSLICSLISLFFADWSGKWRSPLLLQPIQFKVKWCVLSEMSFCTLLLWYWAVIYLVGLWILTCFTIFLWHLSWAKEILKAASHILRTQPK